MDEQQKAKGKLLTTITTFAKDKEGKDRYINILARIQTADGTRDYLVRDRRVSDEDWAEAGRRLKAKEAVIYENPFRGRGAAVETETGTDEETPF